MSEMKRYGAFKRALAPIEEGFPHEVAVYVASDADALIASLCAEIEGLRKQLDESERNAGYLHAKANDYGNWLNRAEVALQTLAAISDDTISNLILSDAQVLLRAFRNSAIAATQEQRDGK